MPGANTSMDWDKLKVFHAAAEAGSFTHAGSGSACRSRRCRGRYQRWNPSFPSRFSTVTPAA